MRFFEHQRQARLQSQRLTLAFMLVVCLLVVVTNLALALPWWLVNFLMGWHISLPTYFFQTNTALVLLYVLGGWWIEASRLSEGGDKLAQRIGAHVAHNHTDNSRNSRADAAEIQFSNIVQELALASNMKPPKAYVLPRDVTINAFAAGWDDQDAVVAVTQGALDYLTREELMGMVAHELGHLYEGDTKLNMRLAGMVLGLELIHTFGESMVSQGLGLLGYLVRTVGWLGWFAGRCMKAAVSREREFLADARAVQFTRSKDGLGGVLRKVAYLCEQDYSDQRLSAKMAQHPAVRHMLLVGDSQDTESRLQSHPPLAERIRRIYGRPMQPLAVQLPSGVFVNPFATSLPLPTP